MKTSVKNAEALASPVNATTQTGRPAVAGGSGNKQDEQDHIFINATCTEIKDIGMLDTPWGKKPHIRITYSPESSEGADKPGSLTYTCTNYALPKSNLTKLVKDWTGRDIAKEKLKGYVDLNSLVGKKARLCLLPVLTKQGNTFDEIILVRPVNETTTQDDKN